MKFDLNLIALLAGIIVAVLTGISVCISIFTRLKDKGKRSKEEKQKVADLKDHSDILAESVKQRDDELKSLKGLNELIKSVIPSAITIAEESGINTGVAKLSFALAKVALWCTENDFSFVENKKLIVDEIEKLIGFSKVVNPRKDETHHG